MSLHLSFCESLQFIETTPGSLSLVAVHAAQLDSKSSRGRLGTFTERWADYLAGESVETALSAFLA